MPVPSNDSRRNLNPDANVYAPRIDAGEVNLNAIEIGPVNYEGSSKSFRTFVLTLFIKNFRNKLHHFSI
jgi:hypothetical protein